MSEKINWNPFSRRIAQVGAGLFCLAALGFGGPAAANADDAARCASVRLKLLGKALKDVATCESKLAARVEPLDASGLPTIDAIDVLSLRSKRATCLDRAEAKFTQVWIKQNHKLSCAAEDVAQVSELWKSLQSWVGAASGTEPISTSTSIQDIEISFPKVVFFAPFCDLDPADYDSDWSYVEAVKAEKCYPDLYRELKNFENGSRSWHSLYYTPVGTDEVRFNWQKAGWPCAHIAKQAGLGRFDDLIDFDIWLSGEDSDPALRFVHSDGPYILPTGAVVADDWADLIDGEVAEINKTASGDPAETKDVITGTNSDGTRIVGETAESWTQLALRVDCIDECNEEADWSFHGVGSSSSNRKWSTRPERVGVLWGEPQSSNDSYIRTVDGVYCFQQRGVTTARP